MKQWFKPSGGVGLGLLIVCSLSLWPQVSGCKLSEAPKYYSMQYTLYHADVVVIGTDVLHEPPPDPPVYFKEGDDNYAIFTVDCVLKSGGYNIARDITILDGAMRTDCHGTHLTIGSEYIMALKVVDIANQTYSIYEPNTLNPGGFEPTAENLKTASTVCDLNESTTMKGACPRRTTTYFECVRGIPTDAAPQMMALSLLTFVFSLFLSTTTSFV